MIVRRYTTEVDKSRTEQGRKSITARGRIMQAQRIRAKTRSALEMHRVKQTERQSARRSWDTQKPTHAVLHSTTCEPLLLAFAYPTRRVLAPAFLDAAPDLTN